MSEPGFEVLEGARVRLRVVADPALAYRAVTDEVARLIERRQARGDRAVLGLATGSTMGPLYAEWVRLRREQGLSFGRVVTFNLDEYRGLAGDHPQSFRAAMQRTLFDHVDLPPEQIGFLDGTVAGPDLERHCAEYERRIRAAGGLDLQLLGLGTNGHIAFNEPGSPPDSRTRRVQLAAATRRANARDFPDPEAVPTAALTMGLGTILEAKRLRLLAFGPAKGEAVRRWLALDGPDPDFPAGFISGHPDLEVWVDQAAVGPA
jgi:glucosamine-6-phosphate deaminase